MTDLTDKERPQVWRLFIRYRRQINCLRKQELMQIAIERSAPDLRKESAKKRKEDEELEKYRKAMAQNEHVIPS